MFATSVCMRSHGVSGFPDPTPRTTPTASPTASDLWLLVPSTINVDSPAFTKAAKASNLSLIGRIGARDLATYVVLASAGFRIGRQATARADSPFGYERRSSERL